MKYKLTKTKKLPNIIMVTINIVCESKSELERRITAYLKEYNPAGYGTRVLKKYQSGKKWYAEITRATTCD